MSSAICLNLDKSKILSSGNGVIKSFSKMKINLRILNIAAKGEIARFDQFHLLSQRFQKSFNT